MDNHFAIILALFSQLSGFEFQTLKWDLEGRNTWCTLSSNSIIKSLIEAGFYSRHGDSS